MTAISTLRFITVAAIVATSACVATPGWAMPFPLLHRSAATAALAEASGIPVKLKNGKLPRGARWLSGDEVFRLYVGNTWQWGEGGGYFGPHGVFRAVTYDDKGVTDGGGTWAVNDKGRLCFKGVWVNAAGRANATSCFDHVLLNGDIYQRKAPGGDWYVFRHGTPEAGDEFSRLAAGNLLGTSPK